MKKLKRGPPPDLDASSKPGAATASPVPTVHIPALYKPWIQAGLRNIAKHVAEKKEASKVRQAEFLKILEQVHFQSIACAAMSINFNLPNLWAWRNPAFKARMAEAQDKGRLHLLDQLAMKAYALARDGWQRPIYQRGALVGHEQVYSPSLIETVADRLARGSWAKSTDMQVNIAGPAAVQINLGDAESRRKYHVLPPPTEGDGDA